MTDKKQDKKQAGDSMEILPDESKSDITPDVILSPYKLNLFVDGLTQHKQEYNAYPMIFKVSQNLVNKDGDARADSHILLDVGSTLDEVTTLRLEYEKAGSLAFVNAVYMLSGDSPHWYIAGGINADGVPILEGELKYLTDSPLKEDGTRHHKAGDFIISKADCTTMRFKIRDVVPHLIEKMTQDFIKTGDSSTYQNLLKSLEGKRADRIAFKTVYATLKKQNLPCAKYMEKLVKLEGEIAELEKKLVDSNKQAVELTDEELESAELEIQAELKKQAELIKQATQEPKAE
jgi:hypothetical protein